MENISVWPWKRCFVSGFKWSLLGAMLTLAFWKIWSLNAPVPVEHIKFLFLWDLPPISRWFDAIYMMPLIFSAVILYGRELILPDHHRNGFHPYQISFDYIVYITVGAGMIAGIFVSCLAGAVMTNAGETVTFSIQCLFYTCGVIFLLMLALLIFSAIAAGLMVPILFFMMKGIGRLFSRKSAIR